MANPFATSNPFGSTSPVETSYQPPPNTGGWQRSEELRPADEDEDYGDEPFTAAHLAAANQAAVPAVAPAAGSQHGTLTFTGAWAVIAHGQGWEMSIVAQKDGQSGATPPRITPPCPAPTDRRLPPALAPAPQSPRRSHRLPT